jgi:LytS/YehU family sensor histidine kinase
MVEQRNLEKRYEELIEQRAAMKGMVNKNKYKEVQEEIQDVSRSLRESTNNLVRSLKENPNVSGTVVQKFSTTNQFHSQNNHVVTGIPKLLQ